MGGKAVDWSEVERWSELNQSDHSFPDNIRTGPALVQMKWISAGSGSVSIS